MDLQCNGVAVGDGKLDGKGVYATRDFAAGEPVVSYELVPLSREDFARLPYGEDLFVHSYGGRRWLYPPPARWVNHADDPSCFPDFDRGCDTALRPIRAGEAVTIDAGAETAHELSTFLDAYVRCRNAGDAGALLELVDPQAVIWRRGRRIGGHRAVVDALIADGPVRLDRVEWLVGTGRWEALCSAEDREDRRHVTASLKIIAGNWQLVYEHRG